MRLSEADIEAIQNSPVVSQTARNTAKEFRAQHPHLPLIAARLEQLADVIDALLRGHAAVLERAELAEFAARQNAETIDSMRKEFNGGDRP